MLSASATAGTGIDALADALQEHRQVLAESGELQLRRWRYQAQWILKRLQDEFGSHGIARLGGEPALLHKLTEQNLSLFEQHETMRQNLLQPGDIHA